MVHKYYTEIVQVGLVLRASKTVYLLHKHHLKVPLIWWSLFYWERVFLQTKWLLNVPTFCLHVKHFMNKSDTVAKLRKNIYKPTATSDRYHDLCPSRAVLPRRFRRQSVVSAPLSRQHLCRAPRVYRHNSAVL